MSELLSIVERKYSPPHWCFMREFRNDTGFNADRFADALAVGLYASRGQLVVGFEVKVSRSDWLRELKEPNKAEAIAQFCDQWNVVVPWEPPLTEIVQESELPPMWGLMTVKGKRLNVVKKAPPLSPKPISRGFLAAIVKRAVDDAVAPHLRGNDEKQREAEERGFERGKLNAARELEAAALLRKQVFDFEEASGIRLNKYADGKQYGAALRSLLDADATVSRVRLDVQNAIESTERTLEKLKAHALNLSCIPSAPPGEKGTE